MARRSIAIIGLGTVAEPHLAAYATLPEVDIFGAVEPRAQRREEIAAHYGIRTFASWDALLELGRPDIACILTPASTHRQITMDCASAGTHVLCEKPMALTLEDAEGMQRACESAGVRLFYGSSYRFLPAVEKAREMIRAGDIGSPRLLVEQVIGGQGADAYQSLSSLHYPTGGPGGGGYGMVDHGIHMLDIFPWLCGKPLTAVLGRGDRTGAVAKPEFALLEMEDAMGMLTYDFSTFGLEMPPEGIFSQGRKWLDGRGWMGDTGAWDPAPGQIRIFGSEGALRIFPYANRLFSNRRGSWREVALADTATPFHFGRQLAQFCADLDCQRTPTVSGADGIVALRALLAVYESEQSRCWISVTSPC